MADRSIDPKTRRVASQQLVQRLRRLVASHGSLSECARRLRRPVTTLHAIAQRHGIEHRRRKLSPEKDRAIRQGLRRGKPLRAIMRDVACGWSAVARRRDALATLAALREQLEVVYRPTSAWRCPGGALVTTDPCVCHNARRPRSRPRRLES